MSLNRSILTGSMALNGDYHANDALQWILANMIPNYSSSMNRTKPTPLDTVSRTHPKGSIIEFKRRLKEYNKHIKAMNLLIDMFNAIVDNGKDKALQFIIDNKQWLR